MSLEAQIAMQLALEDSKKAAVKVKPKTPASRVPVTTTKPDKGRPERPGARKTRSPRATSMEKIPEGGRDMRGGARGSGSGPSQGRPRSGRKDSSASSGAAEDGASPIPHKPPKKTPSFKDLYEIHESMRMHRDITDINYDEKNLPRQALGGGKIENAMEIVEIVNADEPPPPEMEADAIDELARINSMEKVQIWMQATDHNEADCDPPDELEPIPEGKVKLKFSIGGYESDHWRHWCEWMMSRTCTCQTFDGHMYDVIFIWMTLLWRHHIGDVIRKNIRSKLWYKFLNIYIYITI